MKTEINYPQLEIPDGWVCIGYQTPKRGMGYITCNGPEFAITSCDFSECLTSVRLCFRKLEPVDAELESAKKLIGKWVEHRNSNSRLYLIDEVSRDADNNVVALTDKCWFYIEEITPFPLPTWRCCEADRPKKEGHYFLRNKTTKEGDYVFFDRHYRKSMIWHNFEWLDEGER